MGFEPTHRFLDLLVFKTRLFNRLSTSPNWLSFRNHFILLFEFPYHNLGFTQTHCHPFHPLEIRAYIAQWNIPTYLSGVVVSVVVVSFDRHLSRCVRRTSSKCFKLPYLYSTLSVKIRLLKFWQLHSAITSFRSRRFVFQVIIYLWQFGHLTGNRTQVFWLRIRWTYLYSIRWFWYCVRELNPWMPGWKPGVLTASPTQHIGFHSWIWTSEWGSQSPLPYHLAMWKSGADGGNRTRIASLEGWNSSHWTTSANFCTISTSGG